MTAAGTANRSPTEARTVSGAALLLCVAVGCALRLQGLGVHSLWYDECATVHVATSPDLFAALAVDRHPPLSFVLFRIWIGWFGQGDAALRLLPALLSCVSLALFPAVARRWLPPRACLLAVGLYAVSPFLVWYGQEVRMYAFVELGTVLALAGASRCLQAGTPKVGDLLMTGAGAALAFGSHYLGGLVACTILVLAAIHRLEGPGRARSAVRVAVAAALGCALWIPWLVTFLPRQMETLWGHAAKTDLRSLIELPTRLVLVRMSVIPPRLRFLGYGLGAVLLAGLALHVAVLAWRRPRSHLLPLAAFATPIAVALVWTAVGPPAFDPRYLMPAAPGAVLVIASGLDAIPSRILRTLLGAIAVIGCASLTVAHKQANLRDDFRSACAALQATWRPGDRVFAVTGTYEGFSQAPIRHYLRDRPDILASIGNALRDSKRLPEVIPPDTRVHLIYRDAPYARDDLRRLTAELTLLAEGERRFGVQHLLYRR